MLVSKICETCGESYTPRDATHAKTSRYCSQLCYLGRDKKPLTLRTRICKHCQTSFTVAIKINRNQELCSPACRKIFNSIAIKAALAKKPKAGTVTLKCKRCAKEFSATKSEARGVRYCSRACRKMGNIKDGEKWCRKGQHFSPLASFDRPPSQAYRLDSYCKECKSRSAVSYRQENKDKINSKKGEWRRQNLEAGRASGARRRARKLKAGGFHTADQIKLKLEFWNYTCYLCGQSLRGKTYHMDHRKPLKRGGTNWIANLAPACAYCNLSKHDKTEAEFREFMARRVISDILPMHHSPPA